MEGLELIDVAATSALHRGKVGNKDKKVGPFEKRLLVSIITGAVRPRRRPWRVNGWHDPKCPFCGNKEHVWWKCEAWKLTRQKYMANLEKEKLLWENHETREGPGASWYCGIANEDPEVEEHKLSIPTEDYDKGITVGTKQRFKHNEIGKCKK